MYPRVMFCWPPPPFHHGARCPPLRSPARAMAARSPADRPRLNSRRGPLCRTASRKTRAVHKMPPRLEDTARARLMQGRVPFQDVRSLPSRQAAASFACRTRFTSFAVFPISADNLPWGSFFNRFQLVPPPFDTAQHNQTHTNSRDYSPVIIVFALELSHIRPMKW